MNIMGSVEEEGGEGAGGAGRKGVRPEVVWWGRGTERREREFCE